MKLTPLLIVFLLAAPSCQAAPAGPEAGGTFKATVRLFDRAPYAGFMNGDRSEKFIDRFTNQSFWLAVKLVFMPGKFERVWAEYRSTPKLQLLAYTDHDSNQFTVWQPLAVADIDSDAAFDLPDGRKAYLHTTLYEEGALADLNLLVYNKDGELLADETYSDKDLVLPWHALTASSDMYRDAKDGSRLYFIPQSYWNGTDYTHGFVVADEHFPWTMRDFVEVCNGPIDSCASTRPVISVATGLKFTPSGKAKWTVRNLSAGELAIALQEELGL